jgi:hypothetical protein
MTAVRGAERSNTANMSEDPYDPLWSPMFLRPARSSADVRLMAAEDQDR